MIQSEYDVVVVGAGPAGASCSRELVKKGYKVLLIERSKEIGEPNFSSVGTPDYLLEEFGLPQTVVGDFWDKIKFTSPQHHEYIFDYKKLRGYVLKFNELKRFLVDDAANHGCTVLVGTSVTGPILENNHIVGVQFTGVQKGEVKAKIIVDASGPPGIISSKVGLRKDVLCPPTPALEFIMTNVHFPLKNTLEFYVGNNWIPKGYAWIFPMGANTAKVGVAGYNFQETTHGTLLDWLKKFIKAVPWLNDAQELELHGSTISINGGIEKSVTENVITIGDAAGQVNPFAAEGVRHALRSGRMAAGVIDTALKNGDMNTLSVYDEEWKKYVGKKWKMAYLISIVMYGKLTDIEVEKGMQLLTKLTPDDFFEILIDYKFERFLKLFPHAIGHFSIDMINEARKIISE